MEIVTEISRIFIPVVSVIIIIKCILALWLGHPKDKVYGYFTDLSKGKRYELQMWETSIGKAKTNDIVLPYENVSRSQIVIARRYDSWYIHDLMTKNGTLLNGKKIKDKAAIENGDIISFSGREYRFTVADDPVVREKRKRSKKAETKKAPQNQSQQRANPRPNVPVLLNIKTGERLYLTGTEYLLGTSPSSAMSFTSPYVSFRHARLRLYEDGWAIEDLTGKNKTALCGKIINTPQLLFDGDVIALADEKLKFKR